MRRDIIAIAVLMGAMSGIANAQSYYARERLTSLKPKAATPAPAPTPPPVQRTSCNAFSQNYLPPSNATYLRAAVGTTLAARQADAKNACETAGATVCGYNDSAPAKGGGYTIYVSTTKGEAVHYSQGDVYWGANCA